MLLEETIPAVWASLNSWFTPTLLFVFLNLMIGTIAVASGGFGTNQKQITQDPNNNNHQLVRSPSVLQRIRSINLYRYRSQDLTTSTTPFSSITTTTQPPSQQSTVQSFQHVLDDFHQHNAFDNLHSHTSIDDDAGFVSESETDETETETETPTTFRNAEEDHHVVRSLSDTKPASGNMPVKLSTKMKKSASAKSAFSHFEEQTVNLALRPSTVREGKKKELQSFGDDEEVDAKADDFINKFKQQLKLQRLDSILRYKEMLGRGN
ncbi:bromodomain protein [Thalictrum thalictroides]|uniref:Bromodomain protein n=1 Tax=Thalictrum thalictroides TaxID=46969 RepID=A0A7J6VUQ6_THATH|nr:bromodomain protein [Thalictrum thalictroides]